MITINNGKEEPIRAVLARKNKRIFAGMEKDIFRFYGNNEKVPKKSGGQLSTCLYALLSKEHPMSLSEYTMLDYEALSAYYDYYMDIMREYAAYEIPSTKQLFAAYMGISVQRFNDLMAVSDTDLREKAIMINDDFTGLLFANAEASNNNSTATITRGKIKDAGQGLIQNADAPVDVAPPVTPELLMAQAKEIIAKSAKAIERSDK